jgi:hypothetical protein
MRTRAHDPRTASSPCHPPTVTPVWDPLNGLDPGPLLRALDARLVPPHPGRPYWSIYHSSGRYLGAGKTAGRALAAATAHTYLDKPPAHGA